MCLYITVSNYSAVVGIYTYILWLVLLDGTWIILKQSLSLQN
jgi:hypothetical protein